ncbi:STAS domain-containing protein [Microbispora oryzae]|uniref:STAS domain-containing protein n=1 Tax=Microbispora oryzae TaxID=2806554 RepID=UPI001E3A75F9|nr:STAS domain-containing protein [Microbispora oryzae]
MTRGTVTDAVVLSPAEVPGEPPGDLVAVALAGSLDFTNADRFGADLRAAADRGCRTLILDMSGLDFCDSTGLRVLLKARTRLEQQGTELVLAELNARLTRIFTVTGLVRAFTVAPTFGAALGATRPRSSSDGTDRYGGDPGERHDGRG